MNLSMHINEGSYGAFPLQRGLSVPCPAGVFLALQNRGSFRVNNRAEYAKLVRESLATTTK